MNGIEAVTSWFTPTIFLCIVTLLITTIFFRNPHRKLLNLIEEEHLPPLYSVLDRVKSFKFSKHRSESRPDPIEHTTITTTTTTIEPIREESHEEEESVVNHVMRSKSENMENYEAKSRSIARLLRRSFSERFAAKETLPEEEEDEVEAHRPATAREKTAAVSGGDEEVDGKADDFINKFRQQLKLQRSDSILRFKEMINRGT